MGYKYKYVDPTENGYVRFKISKKQHNEIFPHRRVNIFTKIEAYHKENVFEFHYFTNLLGIILTLLLFPFYIILHGLTSFKDVVRDYYRLLNEKQTGSFTSEHVQKFNYNGEINKKYIKLKEIFEKQSKNNY